MSDLYLVTGGAGFIGSHLCDYFLGKGWEVICVDNLLTGNPDNVAHLLPEPGFTFLDMDVTGFIHVAGPVHAILHFASPASRFHENWHNARPLAVPWMRLQNEQGLLKGVSGLPLRSVVTAGREFNPLSRASCSRCRACLAR